ncbi:carboxylesterase family protein, partial [Steroidobacter sp.]|uniref:carboxylesterase family protein n=1 Tax=Steroidobacter sp. TaxID=1978227 RepID=UPI001A5CDC18
MSKHEIKNDQTGASLTRREFLVATASVAAASATMQAQASQPQRSASNSMFRTVETASGKVQGIVDGPVVEFRGIPYGASTAGSNRFMPPRKPASWAGVRECFGHGPISPQGSLPGWDFRTEYFQL